LKATKHWCDAFFQEVMDSGNLSAIPEFVPPGSFLAGSLQNFVQTFKTGFPRHPVRDQ
jgi:hypothetical protein